VAITTNLKRWRYSTEAGIAFAKESGIDDDRISAVKKSVWITAR